MADQVMTRDQRADYLTRGRAPAAGNGATDLGVEEGVVLVRRVFIAEAEGEAPVSDTQAPTAESNVRYVGAPMYAGDTSPRGDDEDAAAPRETFSSRLFGPAPR